MALAAHKIGGPAGVGALWVDSSININPTFAGGGQERGRRGGTPSVVLCAGFGASASEAPCNLDAIKSLRDRLETSLVKLGGVVNAEHETRIGTVSNLSFKSYRGTDLVMALDLEGVCVSSGAACSSGLGEPSPVLLAMYPDEPWRAQSALRFSLGKHTTHEDIERAISAVRSVLNRNLKID